MTSMIILAVCHTTWSLTTERTWMLLPLNFFLSGLAWSGINISMFNLPFQFAPNDSKTVYLGFNATISGIVGYLSTILGGQLSNLMGTYKLTVGSVTIGNLQILFLLSSILISVGVLYAGIKIDGKGSNEGKE